MRTLINNSREDIRWYENSTLCSFPPNHVYFDESHSHNKEQQKLKSNLDKLFEYFDLFNDMNEEERQALYGVFKEQKSMRKISRELGRDNHTIRRRYDTAIKKIKNHLRIYPENNK